jgi:hypothetical protein
VLVIPMPGKRVPECRSGLRPFEKELPERRSGALRHKNTPVRSSFLKSTGLFTLPVKNLLCNYLYFNKLLLRLIQCKYQTVA